MFGSLLVIGSLVGGKPDHGCVKRAGYGATSQPYIQFVLVAINPPSAQKVFSPFTVTINDMSVKLLTGNLELQTRSIFTRSDMNF